MFRPGASDIPDQMKADIEDCGYFPQIVIRAISQSLGGEPVVSWLVNQETAFNNEEFHRHLTVLVLTQKRLIANHTDDVQEDGISKGAITTTESVGLDRINSVVLSHVYEIQGEENTSDLTESEATFSLGWQVMNRIDLEPATCADPQCEVDHGYTGRALAEDLSIRMSATADGTDNLAKLIDFATALQQMTARTR